MRMRSVLLVVGCFVMASSGLVLSQSTADRTGTISGMVMNEASQTIPGAVVRAIPIDDRRETQQREYFLRAAWTDEDGKFVLRHLGMGKYRLFAGKEADDYPNTYWAIYDNDTVSICELTPEAPQASTVVSIGPKAGVITGTILDAVSGSAVDGGVRIWLWTDPKKFNDESASSPYRVLVPGDKPVGIEVHAKGYETWRHISAGSSDPNAVVVKSGETLTLDVRLQSTGK